MNSFKDVFAVKNVHKIVRQSIICSFVDFVIVLKVSCGDQDAFYSFFVCQRAAGCRRATWGRTSSTLSQYVCLPIKNSSPLNLYLMITMDNKKIARHTQKAFRYIPASTQHQIQQEAHLNRIAFVTNIMYHRKLSIHNARNSVH